MPRLLVRYEDLSLRHSEATNIGEENILFPVMAVVTAPIDLKDLVPLLRRKDHDGNGAGILDLCMLSTVIMPSRMLRSYLRFVDATMITPVNNLSGDGTAELNT